jgi:Mn-dependent DtxR family transcriptional regulator
VQVKRKPTRPTFRADSESTEDHLERIAELVDYKGYARVTDVAEKLGLTRSTVSNMVQRLAARGFLNYEKYRGFSLTAKGRAVATRIKTRHETLTELLGLLGLEPETIEQEVEDIEHHLRHQTLEVFAKLVNYWKLHPRHLQAFLTFTRKNSVATRGEGGPHNNPGS